MSKLPIDIISFTHDFRAELDDAVVIANTIQEEFLFTKASSNIHHQFQLLILDDIDADEFLDNALKKKRNIRGFYPYMIFFCDSPLNSTEWNNLYANTLIRSGISIITTNNVPDVIIPKDKMVSYFVYYLTRIILKFILADKYNHKEPSSNGCLFDFMEEKKDLLKSMRPNAICDDCKRAILKNKNMLSEGQLHAIDILLTKSGRLLKQEADADCGKTKIFIGSSCEGLDVARKIKACLKHDAHVDTWADGLFDRPGQAYIEVLENVLLNYEYGIFVFSPDDKVFSRGQISEMPRDNVIFEYGMFLGKHSRRRAFFIVPRGIDIKLMTDVLGITSLDYDPTNPNLKSAVSDACDQIRDIINENLT